MLIYRYICIHTYIHTYILHYTTSHILTNICIYLYILYIFIYIYKKVNKTTEEHKTVKGKIDIKIIKIEAEAELLNKKEQITKGLQKKIQKVIKKKNTLH